MKKDVKESAKEIRKVLRARYPGIKFSVRAKRFASGSSVDVSWTDGPTEREVGKVTAHLKGYTNGFYNEYIGTDRRVSHEVMEAAAKAAAEYYGIEMPKIVEGRYPHIEERGVLVGSPAEMLSDKVHRAAWSTNVYNVDITEAFRWTFPN